MERFNITVPPLIFITSLVGLTLHALNDHVPCADTERALNREDTGQETSYDALMLPLHVPLDIFAGCGRR